MVEQELNDAWSADGAVFGERTLPESFGEPSRELAAASQGSAVMPVEPLVQLELTGRDCRRFLHNFCTNDIVDLAVGADCEVFLTNVKGRVLAHAVVQADDERLLLTGGPGTPDSIVQHLDRYLITEDVTIVERTTDWGQLLVTGVERPNLRELLPASAAVQQWPISLPNAWLISVPTQQLASVWTKLRRAGAMAAGCKVAETLRIQAGLPRYGQDISDAYLAQEVARTSRAISFSKGCYLGQEPIARLDALGHVNRQLCRLHLAQAVSAGVEVHDLSGNPVGTLTSVSPLDVEGEWLGLATLRASVTAPETTVRIATEPPIDATVSGLDG